MHLTGDCFDQARMPIAYVMQVIAVKIHVSLAGVIFDPDTLGLSNRIQAGCRNRLMQKVLRIAIQNVPGLGIDMLRLPVSPPGRTVQVPLTRLR